LTGRSPAHAQHTTATEHRVHATLAVAAGVLGEWPGPPGAHLRRTTTRPDQPIREKNHVEPPEQPRQAQESRDAPPR
jgi:hypothetical protein